MTEKKQNWSYYTPKWLADFIIKYLFENISNNGDISILEPSCWDGVFIKSLSDYWILSKNTSLTLIDINTIELKKTDSIWALGKIEKIEGDFLRSKLEGKYDFIIGNPPYIHKKYLSDEQKEACLIYQRKNTSKTKRIINIWPSFIYRSEELLNDWWILAFVVPEELVKVNYAKDTLTFMQKKFERVEIFYLNKVLFWDAWQNTVLLIGYKQHKNSWMYTWNIDIAWIKNDFSLKSYSISKEDWSNNSQKNIWSWLKQNDIDFIEKLKERFQIIWGISKSQTWIVTWANNYFILNKDTAIDKWIFHLSIPIIQKWAYTRDCLEFKMEDFHLLEIAKKPCYLLKIEGDAKDKNLNKYLDELAEASIHKRYKCGTYKPNWYNIPNIWASKLIFFKRSHLYPKLVLNPSEIVVTDSGYRITTDTGKEKEFQYCFYNSFTLLMIELWWRSYWWWVLEVTPNEFKSLPIPYFHDIPEDKLNDFLKKSMSSMEDILVVNDNYLLWVRLWLSEYEIKRIKEIRIILMNKRIKQ